MSTSSYRKEPTGIPKPLLMSRVNNRGLRRWGLTTGYGNFDGLIDRSTAGPCGQRSCSPRLSSIDCLLWIC